MTKEQRDAIFAQTAATMHPARAPALTELLEWKPQITEYYAKGFSAAQIRDMLRAGGVTTSERFVQRFLARYSHRRRRTSASPERALSDTPADTGTAPSAANDTPANRQSGATKTTAARQPTAKLGASSATPQRT